MKSYLNHYNITDHDKGEFRMRYYLKKPFRYHSDLELPATTPYSKPPQIQTINITHK